MTIHPSPAVPLAGDAPTPNDENGEKMARTRSEQQAPTTEGPKDLRPRRAKISTQMQVRIPAEFFKRYGFGSECLCVPTATGVEYRPVRSALDETCDIIDDLVSQGYSGSELSTLFRERAEKAFSQPVELEDVVVDVTRVDLREEADA